jgi:hypothetical protein
MLLDLPKHVLFRHSWASQNFSTKTGFFLSHFSHRRSETKIAKTSLPGTKPTYDEKKNKKKCFGLQQTGGEIARFAVHVEL